jgi:hypothetical protein
MNTDLPQKKESSPPSLTAGPDFATWQQANLVKFAGEAYSKMCGQAEEIMHLQQDLKTAIEAYRALLRR